MKRLSAAIDRVTIPETWSPSQLIQGTECRLRAILASSGESLPRLPTHPAAELGSLFHKLLENAARGAIAREGDNRRSAVKNELERLLTDAEVRLAIDRQTFHFARLRETLSPIEWHNRVQSILTKAESLLAKAPNTDRPRDHDRRRQQIDLAEIRGQGHWPEVRVRAAELRLAGRMDVVEIGSDDCVVVRDYKSNRIHESGGAIRSSIQLQLRLYGLAVLSNRPDAEVRLVVSDGSQDYPVDFPQKAIDETLTWLDRFMSGLDAGSDCLAESLATPGPACSHCQSRHVCQQYIRHAPTMWISGCDQAPLPLDTWGTVSQIEHRRDQSMVELQDANNCRVKVQRIDTERHQLELLNVGDRAWFFGLSASRARIVNGRFYHPRNFFEIPPNPGPAGRAWSLCVFAGVPAASNL